jgi:hypothetical protein
MQYSYLFLFSRPKPFRLAFLHLLVARENDPSGFFQWASFHSYWGIMRFLRFRRLWFESFRFLGGLAICWTVGLIQLTVPLLSRPPCCVGSHHLLKCPISYCIVCHCHCMSEQNGSIFFLITRFRFEMIIFSLGWLDPVSTTTGSKSRKANCTSLWTYCCYFVQIAFCFFAYKCSVRCGMNCHRLSITTLKRCAR